MAKGAGATRGGAAAEMGGGSAKQVSWANDIRSSAIGLLDANIARNNQLAARMGNGSASAALRAEVKLFQQARKAAMTKANAKWWIDNRDYRNAPRLSKWLLE